MPLINVLWKKNFKMTETYLHFELNLIVYKNDLWYGFETNSLKNLEGTLIRLELL